MNSNIFWFRQVTSTNDVAREMGQSGAPHGTVIIADVQTKGRGTKGRRWHSKEGLGIYASYILRLREKEAKAEKTVPFFPFMTGLAAMEALTVISQADIKLKWPNDLVVENRKLGGILMESVYSGYSFQFAVAGIGLNLNHEPNDFPADLSSKATSLYLVTGKKFDREAILVEVGHKLDCWYNALIRKGSPAILEVYENNLVFSKGVWLSLNTEAGVLGGWFKGLDNHGRLMIQTEKTVEIFSSENINSLDWNK